MLQNQTAGSGCKGKKASFWVKFFAVWCAKISDIILTQDSLPAQQLERCYYHFKQIKHYSCDPWIFPPSEWQCLAHCNSWSAGFISELVANHCIALYVVCKALHNERHLQWLDFSLIHQLQKYCSQFCWNKIRIWPQITPVRTVLFIFIL